MTADRLKQYLGVPVTKASSWEEWQLNWVVREDVEQVKAKIEAAFKRVSESLAEMFDERRREGEDWGGDEKEIAFNIWLDFIHRLTAINPLFGAGFEEMFDKDAATMMYRDWGYGLRDFMEKTVRPWLNRYYEKLDERFSRRDTSKLPAGFEWAGSPKLNLEKIIDTIGKTTAVYKHKLDGFKNKPQTMDVFTNTASEFTTVLDALKRLGVPSTVTYDGPDSLWKKYAAQMGERSNVNRSTAAGYAAIRDLERMAEILKQLQSI